MNLFKLKELFLLLDKVQGVQTVKNINITNKVGTSLRIFSICL
jgi:hypothetical protein